MGEVWSQLTELFMDSAQFRAGFGWGLIVAVVGWAFVALLNSLQEQWNKIRQFFEPTQQPGRGPMVKGPSPARMMLGCVGRVVMFLVGVAIVVVVLWWMLPGVR